MATAMQHSTSSAAKVIRRKKRLGLRPELDDRISLKSDCPCRHALILMTGKNIRMQGLRGCRKLRTGICTRSHSYRNRKHPHQRVGRRSVIGKRIAADFLEDVESVSLNDIFYLKISARWALCSLRKQRTESHSNDRQANANAQIYDDCTIFLRWS